MTSGTVKSTIIGRFCWIVVCANRVSGAQALPFERALHDLREPTAHFDEASERALISCGSGVDEDTNRWNSRTESLRNVDALANGAGGMRAPLTFAWRNVLFGRDALWGEEGPDHVSWGRPLVQEAGRLATDLGGL